MFNWTQIIWINDNLNKSALCQHIDRPTLQFINSLQPSGGERIGVSDPTIIPELWDCDLSQNHQFCTCIICWIGPNVFVLIVTILNVFAISLYSAELINFRIWWLLILLVELELSQSHPLGPHTSPSKHLTFWLTPPCHMEILVLLSTQGKPLSHSSVSYLCPFHHRKNRSQWMKVKRRDWSQM